MAGQGRRINRCSLWVKNSSQKSPHVDSAVPCPHDGDALHDFVPFLRWWKFEHIAKDRAPLRQKPSVHPEGHVLAENDKVAVIVPQFPIGLREVVVGEILRNGERC